MKTSIKTIAISILTLTSSLNVAQAQETISFKDVSKSDWFYSYVYNLANIGVIDTSQQYFRPADRASRAEAVKILVESGGWTINPSAGPVFKDVSKSDWFYADVETAAANGIISGYTDASGKPTGYFGPGDPVTREQFAKMAFKAFNLTENTVGGPHFSDVPTTAWAYPYVETLYNLHIVDGYPDKTFRPSNDINRAELVKMGFGHPTPCTPNCSTASTTQESQTQAT